jgi:ribosomal protein L16 Arg81 hydroxylase
VHLFGRKRWLLVAPGHAAQMYPRGLFSSMPNFSHVDPEQPDWARHRASATRRSSPATLSPGETLFIPHGWWHTRALEDAVAMNFWWGGRAVALLALASSTRSSGCVASVRTSEA